MLEKKIIGLTGPVASGKNTVAEILAQKGFYIIDVDQIGHRVLDIKKPEIVKAFGSQILDNQGQVDRRKLGQLVFEKKKHLNCLEKIVHPLIRKMVQEEINSLQVNYIVVNAAILQKLGLLPLVNEVWVILAKANLRLQRLQAKGLTLEEARQRLKAQASIAGFRRIADKVILNNRKIKDLEKKVNLCLG